MSLWTYYKRDGYAVPLRFIEECFALARATFFRPASKEGKGAPLIFGSTCRTKLLTKPQHSSLPDFEAPKAVVAKFKPSTVTEFQRYIFCHQHSFLNRPPCGG